MKFILQFIIIFFVTACTSNTIAIKVKSVDDIPDIAKLHKKQLAQLKLGMEHSQVRGLFPYAETECFPSGVCNVTVFRQDLIQINAKLVGLRTLTGSLMSLLALTCILANENCNEAAVAALNLGVASAIEESHLRSDVSSSNTFTLVQWINIEIIEGKVSQWAINQPLSQFQNKQYKNQLPPLDEALTGSN